MSLYSFGDFNPDLGVPYGYIGQGYDYGNPDTTQMNPWAALFDSPQFKAGYGMQQGQNASKTMYGAFNDMTKNKLDYIRSLAAASKQVTPGGNVPAAPQATAQAWNPAMIAQLLTMLAQMGAR